VLTVIASNDLARLGRIASLDIEALASAAASAVQAAGLNGEAAIRAEGRAFGQAGRFGGDAELSAEKTALAIFPPHSSWDMRISAFGEYLRTRGAGELGLYPVFSWAPEGNRRSVGKSLRPVSKADPVRLSDLSLYEEQRAVVVSNTLRFINRKSANNLLLYGDRGTGKSATVKAVCREYSGERLRLIEVRKDYLGELPALLEYLGRRNQYFVIFIDDLSFGEVDESFTGLKALLEGGVETRPANTVIYATSNRRHLVKEAQADRPSQAGGEVRAFDSMQEQLSLADRFGVTVIFTTPDQEEYLKIAEHIAYRRGFLKGAEEDPSPKGEEKRRLFRENALRWERWFNGRSPRTAVQFVDWITGGEGFPWD